MKYLLLFMIMLLNGNNSFASDFKPLVGLNLGYGMLSGQEKESDKNGMNVGAKLIGSWEFKQYYIDGSVGYQLEFFKADYISIQNNSPFSELSFRQKMNDNWSLGPMVQLQSGVYATTPTVHENNKLVTNLGLQLLYDQKDDKPRFELSVLKLVAGIDERDLFGVRIGIQFPFGEGSKKQVKKEPQTGMTAKNKQTTLVPVIVVPSFVSKSLYVNKNKILLRRDFLGFKLNSSELDYQSLVKLKKLATLIMDKKVEIKKINISGHSDKIGTEKYNLKLSQARADTVKQVFVDTNVDSKCLITSKGHSFLEPLSGDDEFLTVKNRRTEIELIGIKDEGSFKKEFNKLINSDTMPQNKILTKEN